MSKKTLNIQIVVGTVRSGRTGRRVADWYLTKAKQIASEVEFEILDTADLALPLFNDPTPPAFHQYNPLQKKVAEKIERADGFVFVTGEYNHSIPGSLKNLLDYVAAEWNHKVAAFVGYGGEGAIRSIEHLIQVLNYLKVATTSDHVRINKVWQALDENGIPRDEFLDGDIAANVRGLIQWSQAFKEVRSRLAS